MIGSQHGDHAHRYSVDAAGNRLKQGVDKQQGLADNRHHPDDDRIVQEETDNQRTTVVYELGSFMPRLRTDDQLVSAYITEALGTSMQLVTPNG
ncbi:hypothetical protein [Halomonas sp. SpR8]|uniref:hypothetical protein n=1 Tax=Halomonas sp. SpR8 TaxID=3050463 RepID=UPI0027E5290C|nr:hypothetical protein [Halomonas sp. SpR8]MDQ7727217.1 hypothetical protein [Halomonas sp. SpR8]